jgi:tripartite-type tricarboxylate transporter receptor subunit TctC
VLAINPRLPISSVKDLIRLAQQKAGELEYASAGIGTFQHPGGERSS